MKTLFFLLLTSLISVIGFCQKPKSEIIERKGQVIEIAPGFSFAYTNIVVKTESDTLFLSFPPHYGELITSRFKKGSEIELRAKVVPSRKAIKGSMKFYFFLDELMAVYLDNNWTTLTQQEQDNEKRTVYKVFLEKTIQDEYFFRGARSALLFDRVIGYSAYNTRIYYPMGDLRIGQKASFIGYKWPRKPGYVYPQWNDGEEVYTFVRLYKQEGEVSAYLYKQNYVCIGLAINANGKNVSLSFPSDRAKDVVAFAADHGSMTVYYRDYKIEDPLNPPELHALVSGRDSLFIDRFGFYGGADVKHDHKPVTIEGKISTINRSAKGKIMSVILGNDYYIEVDYNVEKQLTGYLKRGNMIKVNGQERVRHEGEIYSKNYRIITPAEITIADKVFLLNALPQ